MRTRCGALLLAVLAWALFPTRPLQATDALVVPAWLFPQAGDLPLGPYNAVTPLHLPDSQLAYTEAQLFDQFSVPDWHPASHPTMPPVVAHGQPPAVYACGYCHLANGQGRPENASLAGLSTAYILQQIDDFKSGMRRVAWPGANAPSDSMIQDASHVSAASARLISPDSDSHSARTSSRPPRLPASR